MAGDPQPPVFLARSRYRARRRIDALRLLPWLGVLAFVLPALLLPLGERGAFSAAVVYFFLAWAALIALCAVLSFRVDPQRPDPAEDER